MPAKSEIANALETVQLHDGFWGRIIERTVQIMLPHVLEQCETEGHVRNMEIAAGRSTAEYSGGADRDSDLYKVLEGAAYALKLFPTPELKSRLDALIDTIAAAQQSDGYLQSYISSQTPDARYADLERSHELYCIGHLLEAAVAHYESTGTTSFLDVATKLADHVDATFGPGKLDIPPGHQEIELALVRLYHVTGEKRYLDLGRYFVDLRGDPDMVERQYGGKPIIEGDRTPGRNRPPEYRQDHQPILDQRVATGHAVRAGYTYAALADVAMEYDSEAHATAAKAIWGDVVSKKLYLSGGVGTHQYHDEGYGDDYLLPNTGYCETCGGIAFLLFSHRLGLLTGDSKYADVVELILYNHFLSSTDLSGCNTFYRNPLSAQGPRQRHPWNYPACCPTNVVRIAPQFPRLMYGTGDNCIVVDQFASSTTTIKLNDGAVTLVQDTNYPWKGSVVIAVIPETQASFALHVRIPGWVEGKPVPSDLYNSADCTSSVRITVNGESVDASARHKGYCLIQRTWKPGDRVEIDFPMPVQRVHAHPEVEANVGRVAIMRGPLLYCVEDVDLNTDAESVNVSSSVNLNATHDPDLLGGATVIDADDGSIRAVPFCLWNNRQPGKMAVWIKEE